MNVGTNQIVVALVLLSTPLGLNAQTGARQGDPDTVQEGPDNNEYNHDEAPRARAVRSQNEIDVDGRLDESICADAPPITEFIQEDPAEGEPGTERTDFRIVYDDDAIYIGATLYDSYPITTYLNRRDVGSGDFDFIMVNLDSYHDHETAYQFAVNPSGAIRDAVSSSGGGGRGGIGGDTSWDPVWDVATQVLSLIHL